MNQSIKVAFVGNPNCGKTTLFNALTGSKLKVANWPGVTVEKVEGEVNYQNYKLNLIDTPGIYSLSSYTIEERVTRECLMDSDIEVIVNVIDASSLERNLYLTLQLLELGKPIILALNMMDIVRERGMEIDLHRLPELLGDIPVIPVSAIKKEGFSTLLHAVIHHYEEGPQSLPFNYGEEIESKIDKIEVMLEAHFPSHCARRWHAIKFLEYDEEIRKEHPINIANIVTKNYEKQIIQKKYGYIEQIVKECVFHYEQKAALTEKIDSFLTHPIWGMPIFLCIMAIVFFFTFTVGDFFKGYLEILIDIISSGLSQILIQINKAQWLVSLIINGIIAGVGGILTFLTNIEILFIAFAILVYRGFMS